MRILVGFLVVILAVCAFIGAMVFSVNNAELVTVDGLLMEFTLPISLWIFGALFVGGLLGVLASSGLLIRLLLQKQKTRRAQRVARNSHSVANA